VQGEGASERRVVWRNRKGEELGVAGEPGYYFDVRLSHGGSLAFVTMNETGAGNADGWILELSRNLKTRLTFDPTDDWGGAWSPDDGSLFFGTNRRGPYDLFRTAVSGASPPVPLLESERSKFVGSVSPDGRLLAFAQNDPDTGLDLWTLPLEGGGEPQPLLVQPFNQTVPIFSPDGRWVAYDSDESGRFEVYVMPFPGPGRKSPVPPRGVKAAAWRGDGREIYYLGAEGSLMAVPVEPQEEGLAIGAPEPLFPVDFADLGFRYDVTPDGRRFLVIEPEAYGRSDPITVVVNWTARLPR